MSLDAKAALFVISGPSGSGKTTLAEAVLKDKKLSRLLARSVSFTTRERRPAERQGRDYFFITGKEFRQKRRGKKILEWTRYLGYYYGTAKDLVEKQLRRRRGLMFCIDIRGAASIKRLYPSQAVTVFIMPPSIQELARRIKKRNALTSASEIRRRMKVARTEMRAAGSYDYIVKNDDFRRAAARLKQIVLKELNNRIRTR